MSIWNNKNWNFENKQTISDTEPSYIRPHIPENRNIRRLGILDITRTSTRQAPFDTWEFFYFPYLLRMRDIFLKNLGKNYSIEYYNSWIFFRKFAKMVYNNSSGFICSSIEPPSSEIENLYFSYQREING